VSADLIVTVDGGGAFLKIHTFENGVFAVFFADLQNGLLSAFFPGKGGVFRFFFAAFRLVVGKEIQLLRNVFLQGNGLLLGITLSAAIFTRRTSRAG